LKKRLGTIIDRAIEDKFAEPSLLEKHEIKTGRQTELGQTLIEPDLGVKDLGLPREPLDIPGFT